jgi:hypothetical protein
VEGIDQEKSVQIEPMACEKSKNSDERHRGFAPKQAPRSCEEVVVLYPNCLDAYQGFELLKRHINAKRMYCKE